MWLLGLLLAASLSEVLSRGEHTRKFVAHSRGTGRGRYGYRQQVDFKYNTTIMDIDEGIQYGYIQPYIHEWKSFWVGQDETFEMSPFQFWFKCIDNEVRGWFFFEDVRKPNHTKEAEIQDFDHVRGHVRILADGEPLKLFRLWHGGGDFFFDIPSGTPSDHMVKIEMKGFRHFTRFKVSNCVKKKPVATSTKSIMHIHLREYTSSTFNPMIIDGIANHMAYHRCALKLDKYEVVIQQEHLGSYLQHPKIAYAVREGWITFLVRNPIIPSPVHEANSPSNCYYQSYTQNMAILQHWKENVRIFFWDSDEYLALSPSLQPAELVRLLRGGPSIGFDRKMAFCNSCDKSKEEIETMSLSQSEVMISSRPLAHPKLVVDPNKVGCYIVHWAGCGAQTRILPLEKAYILHFENLYQRRWKKEFRLKMGNETVFQPSTIQKMCDPTLYDWSGPLPSFFD